MVRCLSRNCVESVQTGHLACRPNLHAHVKVDVAFLECEAREALLARCFGLRDDGFRLAIGEHFDAETFNLLQDKLASGGVELSIKRVALSNYDRHVCDFWHVVHRLGSFEAEELGGKESASYSVPESHAYPSADDSDLVDLRLLRIRDHVLDIGNVAVYKLTTLSVPSRTAA